MQLGVAILCVSEGRGGKGRNLQFETQQEQTDVQERPTECIDWWKENTV